MKSDKKILTIIMFFMIGMPFLLTFVLISQTSFDIRNEAKKAQSMDNLCNKSDITGSSGSSDTKVDSYDLSMILVNWKWKKEPKDTKADIWGKSLAADGNVDMFDLARVLYCWRITRTDLGPRCGDGIKNGSEECDPPGGTSQCGGKTCQSNCTCAKETTTTSSSTTTTSSSSTTTSSSSTTTSTTLSADGTCSCGAILHGCAQVIGEMCGWDSQVTTLIFQSLQNQCTVSECKTRLIQMADTECKAMNDPSQCSKVDDAKDVTASWAQ